MKSFEALKINKPQLKALSDLGVNKPTPIQVKALPAILSGNDVVGLAQTGTGKTFAYLLPILKQLQFSDQIQPRVLILVPTRELVSQVVDAARTLTKYQNVRIEGVFGGVNINNQRQMVSEGLDILVATPGRLFDLAVSGVLRLSAIQKLVIDEVDEMLFIGFRPQLMNILDILPKKRQNILFSATLTEDVDTLIKNFFRNPKKIEIVPVGTPLEKITQKGYPVPNYNTKVNFLKSLLSQRDFEKVLVFVKNKKIADRLFENLQEDFTEQINVIHSNKSQNFRFNAIDKFQDGTHRILIATDIVSRGMDIKGVTHVINFDTPSFPEQYIHRIGRTGRAREHGEAILLFTPAEEEVLLEIEILMQTEVPAFSLPEDIEISKVLMPEEKDHTKDKEIEHKKTNIYEPGPAFHEKSEKNRKVNLGGSYKREIKKKYKKPKTRMPKTKGKK
ncbi:MAG: DEAD/DEAH box helicase [Flavobacteriaceae bacterium]|nr:DEAD/DEAH box helicase [Flavobacteriaceae bacterium]